MEARKLTLDAIESCDLYDIKEFQGHKWIDIIGYYWERSDHNDVDSDGTPLSWAFTEGTHLTEDLSVFVHTVKVLGVHEFMDAVWSATQQYQHDMTREQAEEDVAGLKPRVFLPYSELTEDTPCGRYVNPR